jgi:hypothetical protein
MKTNVTNTINGARDAVGLAIDKIKGFFDFKWELPKLKLPKISIQGKFSLAPPSIPTFGIKWNAAGAIFNAPTILPSAQGFQGVGEAGPEAIMPIRKLPELLKPFFEQKGESQTTRTELHAPAQPTQIILKMGRQTYKAYVKDISREQDADTELELAYS